jgi:hypothetical protein
LQAACCSVCAIESLADGSLLHSGGIHATLFGLMWLADGLYVAGQLRSIAMGFPIPTALMLYGVGGFPLLLAVVYWRAFDHLVFSSQESEKLQQIARTYREQTGGAD